jgi:hypothetical protein
MSSRYWRLDGFDGVDLLRSDASTHRHARHSQEGYALGVVEAGAHAFAPRGRVWTAIPGRVIVVNLDDAPDGGPATRSDARAPIALRGDAQASRLHPRGGQRCLMTATSWSSTVPQPWWKPISSWRLRAASSP